MAFPRIVGDVVTNNGFGRNVQVTLPTGIVVGELLEIAYAVDTGVNIVQPTGWTPILQINSGDSNLNHWVTLGLWMKIADGTESTSYSLRIHSVGQTSKCWAVAGYRITDHGVTILPGDLIGRARQIGVRSTPDPPNVNAGTVDDYLFQAFCAVDADSLTGAPTNYSHGVSLVEGCSGENRNATLGVAGRQLRASSDDPGVFSGATDSWAAYTFAIPPSLTPAQALTPNLVTQLASAFNPTLAQPVLDQALTPNLVSQLTQVFDPSLKTAIKLTLPLVAQIAQERTHVVSGSVYQDGNFYYIGQAGNNVVPQSGALPTEWMVGGATGYLTIAAVTSGGQVLLRTDVVKTYGGIQPGPEFLPAVETGIRLTFEGGGSSVEVTGITDTTEPYLWTPSNSLAVAAFYGGLSVGASVSLSLRYPPAGTGLVEVFSPALEVLEPLVTLSPSLVTRLATAHDPALSVAQGLTLTLVTSLATTFDPVTSLNLSPSLVTQRVRTFNPTLKATAGLTPNRVSQLVRVFDPTLRATAELAPSLVKQLVTGFDPTIETVTGLAPSLVEQPVTVFDPALSTGPVELTLPAVLRLVVVADPALRHSLALNLVTQLAASFDPTFTQLTSTQEGYRWRNDDGTETTATWLADQDADVSVAELVTVRLRGIVDWEDDPEPGQIGIEYRRTGVGDWRAV